MTFRFFIENISMRERNFRFLVRILLCLIEFSVFERQIGMFERVYHVCVKNQDFCENRLAAGAARRRRPGWSGRAATPRVMYY